MARRWGMVPLVDMLKEAVLRTGCLDTVTSVATGGSIPAGVLAERLLLAIHAYGTNTGIRAVAAGGHGHSEADIRYARRRYLTVEAAQAIAIADATFAVRRKSLWGRGVERGGLGLDSRPGLRPEHLHRVALTVWGPGSSHLLACRASLHLHGRAFSIDLMHGIGGGGDGRRCAAPRHHYGRRGQLRRFPRPVRDRVWGHEAAGLRPVAEDQADQPGQALPPRPGRPRRLPRPGPGHDAADPLGGDRGELRPDDQVRHRHPARHRLDEAILRRFTRNASHPTYTAMLEVGRAQKTIFCARYLRDRDVQREIGEGLNVVESWNGANGVIAYGKGGEITSNRRDEQEMFVLCLRILQAAMVYVNTLMLQDVMGDATWADVFTPADRRGLTPLFWIHVLPYGEVKLDMSSRLDIGSPDGAGDAD